MTSNVVVIELSGVPGVGKSSMFSKTMMASPQGVVFFTDSCIVPGGALLGTATATWIGRMRLLGRLLLHVRPYWPAISFSLPLIWDMGCSLRTKIALSANMLLKLARFEYVKDGAVGDCVLFDEGIAHLPFNLADYSRDGDLDPAVIFRHLQPHLKQVDLALISAGRVDLGARLRARGHKRVDISDPVEVEKFVNRNFALEALLGECLADHVRRFCVVSADDPNAETQLLDFIRYAAP